MMSPTLYLMCGLPGAGKTTRANELEAAGHGVLLNGDQWICQVYPDDAEAAARDDRRGFVEKLQWELVEQLLAKQISVILDWGVWTKAERVHLREQAQQLGAKVETVFVDAPIETLHERLAERNLNLPPGTFRVTPDELDEWFGLFEPPSVDELAGE